MVCECYSSYYLGPHLAVGSSGCRKLQTGIKREPGGGKDEAYKPREYHMGACAVPRRYLDICEWDGWPVQQKYHVQASYGAAGAWKLRNRPCRSCLALQMRAARGRSQRTAGFWHLQPGITSRSRARPGRTAGNKRNQRIHGSEMEAAAPAIACRQTVSSESLRLPGRLQMWATLQARPASSRHPNSIVIAV